MARQALHRRDSRLPLVLRVVVCLALAFLTLPLLNSAASADGSTTDVTTASPAVETTLPPPDSGGSTDPATTPGTDTSTSTSDPVSTPASDPVTDPGTGAGTGAGTDPSTTGDSSGGTPKTKAAQLTLAGPAPAVVPVNPCDQPDDTKVTAFEQYTNYDRNGSGEWANGNMNTQKANLVEGQFVWQRVTIGNLHEGPQQLVLTYDVTATSGNKTYWAYDFLDHFSLTDGNNLQVSVSPPPPHTIDVTTATATVTWDMPPNTTTTTLEFGAHVASEWDHGIGTGAGSISGSPYHVSLETLNCNTAGQQDNQIMASAIQAGQIVVAKDAQPNSPQDFTFTIHDPSKDADFPITLDDDNDPTLPNHIDPLRLAPGSYVIRETDIPAPWSLSDISCTSTALTNQADTTGAGITAKDADSVTVTIKDKVLTSCTFTNVQTASVSVDKYWVINGGDPVANGSQPPSYGLSAGLTLTGPGTAGATSQDFGAARTGYRAGDHTTIAETTTVGNNLCSLDRATIRPPGGSATALPANGYDATLTGGANAYTLTNYVTCKAHLKLVKQVANGPAAASDWTLSATGGSGDLAGPSGTTGVDGDVTPGATYTLSEDNADPVYAQDGAWSCTNGVSAGGGQVSVPAGVSTTCTVTNATAKLVLKKVVENTHGGALAPLAFTLKATPEAPAHGAPDVAVTGSSTGVGSWVRPGVTYDLSEGSVAGYSLRSLQCDTGSGGAMQDASSVTLSAGDTVTCTFTNVDVPSKLTLTKVVDTSGSGTTYTAKDFTLTATLQSAPYTVLSGNGQDGFVAKSVSAGVWALDESGPAGFDAGTWDCGDAHPVGTTNGKHLVTIGLDENVTCQIVNTAKQPHLTLVKVVDNGTTGADATPTDWTLTASGPETVSGTSGSADATDVGVLVGAYQLSESGGPGGYTASAWDCGPDHPVVEGSVTLALGDDVTCTITNTATESHLTLVKKVDNGRTGADATPADWTLTAEGPATISGAGGTSSAVPVGSYVLSESGPGGYTASGWDCGKDHPASDGSVRIALGDDVTCTITNTAIAPKLTLVKHVDNGTTGATAKPTDWTLHAANGDTTIEGTTGSPSVTGVTTVIGDFTLSESGGPAGYTASAWDCGTDHPVTNGAVALALGDDVTCQITNTADQPHLTLVKHVDNGATGATATATDWLLLAEGDGAGIGGAGGTSSAVPVGSYVLSESGPGGYTASGWDCGKDHPASDGSVRIALGDDVTCTITNTATAPRLTLVKHVDNGTTGATAKATDWTLHAANGDTTIEGTTGSPSVTGVTTVIGDFTLSESGGPAGYTASAWDCGTDHPVTNGAVALALGDDVTCQITNTAQQPHLTLVKHVDNGTTGGTAKPTDWTLSADSQTGGISGAGGATGAVKIGTYTLSESGLGGYAASAWDCGDHKVTSNTVTLGLGDDVTCQITNTAVPGSWLVTKSSDPASGSTVQPGDTITYTVTAAKTGGVDPTDVQVLDDLSQVLDHATVVSGPVTSTGTASIDQSTQKLTWAIPALHGTETVTYTVRVDDGAWGVTLKNLVTSPGSDSCPQAQPDCHTTEHHTPAWALTKVSDPASGTQVQPGSDITYTLHAVNTSDTVVAGATAVDDLSKVLNHASLDKAGLDPALSLDGTTLTWTLPTLAPGEEATVSYTVTVDTDAYDVVLGNVVVPVGAGGVCVQAADCRTSHPTGPQVLGEEVFRPQPKPKPASRPPLVLGTPLPSTGAPNHDRLFGLAGATGLVLGACLMLADRRRRAMNR